MPIKLEQQTERGTHRCQALLRVCKICGRAFKNNEEVCPVCGTERKQCALEALEGTNLCRLHTYGKPYSLYAKLAATLSDTVLEEVIEYDDKDLSQEYALAKVALSHVLDNPSEIDSRRLIGMIKTFFEIAEKRNNIEKGQVLNIAWDDKMVAEMRRKIRNLIMTMKQIIEDFIEDKELKHRMLEELYNRTKTPIKEAVQEPKVSYNEEDPEMRDRQVVEASRDELLAMLDGNKLGEAEDLLNQYGTSL